MLTVMLVLWCSAAAGYALRRHPVPQTGQLATWSVWLLLFLMGKDLGESPVQARHIGRLGAEALALALATWACCTALAWGTWKHVCRKQQARAPTATSADEAARRRVPVRAQLTESGFIVLFFAAGCVAGRYGWLSFLPAQASFYALCLLLACVGFGLGQNRELRSSLQRMDKRLVALPLLTIAGTWAGALFTACVFTRHGTTDWLAASSGFGYYSLSGILITELRGPELGAISLMYNILREMIVLLGAPFLCRFFGPLAPICQGGATSGDTTLPFITAACGSSFIPLSVYHGVCVDFTVPFLVPFFCSLA